MKRIEEVNGVEWPKDEDYVPDSSELDNDDDGPHGDDEYADDYDPHAWLGDDDEHYSDCGCPECDPDDNYGPY